MRVDHLTDVQLALRPHRITGPVMAAFLDAGAIQPAAALRYRSADPAASEAFERLVAAGVLRPAGGGHWFDLRRHYEVEHARTLRRAAIGGAIALAIAGAAVLFY